MVKVYDPRTIYCGLRGGQAQQENCLLGIYLLWWKVSDPTTTWVAHGVTKPCQKTTCWGYTISDKNLIQEPPSGTLDGHALPEDCLLGYTISGDNLTQEPPSGTPGGHALPEDCLLGLYHWWWNLWSKNHLIAHEVVSPSRNPESSSSSSTIFCINKSKDNTLPIVLMCHKANIQSINHQTESNWHY